MRVSLNRLSPFQPIIARLSAIADSIKVNTISQRYMDARDWVVKRRNVSGFPVTSLANVYFRLAHVPIRYCSRLSHWQRWEIECYRMLNADGFEIHPLGRNTVCEGKVPGESVWAHLQRKTLTRRIVIAAAEEFRRAHRMWSEELGGYWSHGDASMSNVIYDPATRRARLIDFEIIHDKSLPAAERHADDLMVFLLDLVGFVSDRRWLALATCFLRTYGSPEVSAALRNHLFVPTGIARIWWKVRTNFINSSKIQ